MANEAAVQIEGLLDKLKKEKKIKAPSKVQQTSGDFPQGGNPSAPSGFQQTPGKIKKTDMTSNKTWIRNLEAMNIFGKVFDKYPSNNEDVLLWFLLALFVIGTFWYRSEIDKPCIC